MFHLVGLALVGGAVALSRSSRRGLRGLGSPSMGPNAEEALDASWRAAEGLYQPVDAPRSSGSDLFWDSDEYVPVCGVFGAEALEALNAAGLAEDAGEQQATSVKIAAVQAWALSQAECGDSPRWAYEQATRPVRPL